jgi:hypothetical protein
MEHFTPKYRRDPNARIDWVYHGVAPGGLVVTSVRKRHPVEDRMETVKTYEPGLVRGQGGWAGKFIVGGMESTLDEIEYLVLRQKEKTFVPRKGGKEIADMGRALMERRNDRIKYLQRNPSEKPKPKPVRLHLPVGCKWVGTSEPGFKVLARI